MGSGKKKNKKIIIIRYRHLELIKYIYMKPSRSGPCLRLSALALMRYLIQH